MKEEIYVDLESMANTCDKPVKLKTTLKNKIHNLLNAQGKTIAKERMSSDKGPDRMLHVSHATDCMCRNRNDGGADKKLEHRNSQVG